MRTSKLSPDVGRKVTVSLQVGKRYVLRNGDVIHIIREDSTLTGVYVDSKSYYYDKDGHFRGHTRGNPKSVLRPAYVEGETYMDGYGIQCTIEAVFSGGMQDEGGDTYSLDGRYVGPGRCGNLLDYAHDEVEEAVAVKKTDEVSKSEPCKPEPQLDPPVPGSTPTEYLSDDRLLAQLAGEPVAGFSPSIGSAFAEFALAAPTTSFDFNDRTEVWGAFVNKLNFIGTPPDLLELLIDARKKLNQV